MGLRYDSLDEEVRGFMLEEFEADTAEGRLYLSARLTDLGAQHYPGLLRQAVRSHDDGWLAAELRSQGLIRDKELRKGNPVSIPSNAPEMLAEGEFNRFYLRGLSRKAIVLGIPGLEIYRAKAVQNPRSQSELLIGKIFDPRQLLLDIRSHPGVDTALGLPPGPNSGLSARIPIG